MKRIRLFCITFLLLAGSAWAQADLRLLGGYQGAAGESAAPKGRYFFEVSGEAPIRGSLGTWGFARISAMPQQVDAPVRDFVAELATNVGNVKVNELGHSAEFVWGIKKSGGTLSPLAGFGVTSPLNPHQNIEIFKVDSQVKQLFPETADKDYVAFVPPQRDRSFWQYMIGARFSLEHAWLDLTIGQNEAITGGRFGNAVVRAEGNWRVTDFSHAPNVYVLVSGMYKLGRARLQNPLILESASNVAVPGHNVAIVPTPLSNLDVTRFGFAIDFGCIIRRCEQ